MLEVLAFVRPLLINPAKEVAAPLANVPPMEVEAEEEAQEKEELGGSFSSFSTSLCSLEVSEVGVEEAREQGEEVDGPGALGKGEKGKES